MHDLLKNTDQALPRTLAACYPVMAVYGDKGVAHSFFKHGGLFLRFLDFMRRIFLHIAFWTVYYLQEILLSITWSGPSLHVESDGHLLWIAAQASLVGLASKLLLTYFVLAVSIKQILSGKSPLYKIVTEILLVFAFSIILYWAVSFYIVSPHIYKTAQDAPPLDIRTVLVAMIDIGFIAGLAVAIKFVRIQLVGKEREKNLVKEKLETELKFLRNQINPHFLMNTLNNIYALARKKSEDTPEVVMRLSELLRFMLYESGGDFISLAAEIKVLEDYLELETIRYNERLSVSFEREIDNDSYQIRPMLLLPFIENAFKYGVSETRFKSFINIHIRAKNGCLNFMVENTKDINDSAPCKNNIGLVNVRRRLELTYKEYALDVKNVADIFTIDLSINLNSHVEI